ncbi:DUF4351 domain-containing protein [Chamaesiphon sp.]|uniref:DUF4351 domain-containing protein n=1 Tax=Chamaesiphon sp. TaxID=2814140 RepID=UPI0035931005
MRESVIYQEILQEGRIEGRIEGRDRGRVEEGRALVIRILNRKLGNLNLEPMARVNSLPIDRVESLGEALLDFSQMSDLLAWLDANQ